MAQDIDLKVKLFTQILLNILDETVPVRKIRMHPSDKPWMTPYIKSEIKRRQRAFVADDMPNYQALKLKVMELTRDAKLRFYENKTANLRSTDPSKWFKSIYRLCGDGGSANQVPSSENLAEKLQEAFTRPWHDFTPTMVEVQPDGLLVSCPRLPRIRQVKHVLKQLNARKATGADNIPAWVFKRFAEELAVVTHDIITANIVQNKYPTMHKHALVNPVPKVHPPEKIESDFRQISVLPVMAKILEKVQILLNKDKLSTKRNQHAFAHGRSTLSALINISQNWFNDTNNKLHGGRKSIHALFVDFS